MLRKGFRQRAVRYIAFLLVFFPLYALWAALFGRYDFVVSTLKALPFSLLAAILLDMVGFGHWLKRSKVRRSIPTAMLVLAIVVISYYGELWAAIPLMVMFAWIIGYVLKQQLSMRGGQVTPPHS